MQIQSLVPPLVAAVLFSAPARASIPLALSVSDVEVSEEDCAAHVAVFHVRLARDPEARLDPIVTVQYATGDGTAVGGIDYTPVAGTLTLTRLERAATVVVPVVDALVPGPDKTFMLLLSNASGAVIVSALGTATLHAPTVAKCASCAWSCDDGAACTADSCSASLGCRHVDVNRCDTPVVLLGACGLDSDGDGLSDAWETAEAIDSNCDGAITPGDDQALPDADPARPDIYLLYDAMRLPDDGGGCTLAPIPGYPYNSPDCAVDQWCLSGVCRGHGDAPDAAALESVVAAFATHGIALHLEVGAVVPHSRVVSYGPPIDVCTAASASLPGARRAIDFYDLKAGGFDPRRRPAYHYAVFGHFHTCDSPEDCAQPVCALPDAGTQPLFTETGLAEQPGNDLIVSFGRLRDRGFPPTLVNEGGSFMHELGHNLGLEHGGPKMFGPEAHINFKPNYLSVMNYAFQSLGIPSAATPGSSVPVSIRLDYSNAVLPSLDESALDESAGIGSGGNDITRYYCPVATLGPGTGPIDWNCDGSIETGVAAEINNDGTTDVLVGHADWPYLVFDFQRMGAYNDGPASGELANQRELDAETGGSLAGLSVADVEVSEEDCAPHAAVFRVRLAREPGAPAAALVTVDYATEDGTGVAGVDYTPTSGTLAFTPTERAALVSVPIADALAPGRDKTFALRLTNASGAVIVLPVGTATLHAPTVAKCASCALSCDDGLACTADSCSSTLGCRNVDVNACATPVCGLGTCGLDSDGDGFSDLQEDHDYVDVDCDGSFEAGTDFAFPHQAAHVFSAVGHVGTGSGQVFPTAADATQPIAASSVAVTIVTGGAVNVATFTYTVDGGEPIGPLPARPVTDIAGNLRLMFYLSFVPGDTYGFTTAMGPDAKVADRLRPNLYVQYDSMGWDAPGVACATNDDCIDAGGTNLHPNDVCHAGFCNHEHAPGDPLFRKVVDPFAAHGITLYVDPVHQVVPHAQVVTWARASDLDNGPLALCAGWDVIEGDIGNGGAVSFFDIKYRPGSDFALDPFRKNVFHYSVFGHFATCLTDEPNAPIGNCNQCPVDRATPRGQPTSRASGLAELPGNDFILSLGASLFNPLGSVARHPFMEPGVFMHELGHNLGLHHAGDVPTPAAAPNYLSVMNGKYVFSGIQHAANPGSSASVESLRELDYSEHTLETLVESALDENEGTSAASAGFTGIVRFSDGDGANGAGPESGAIDWDGDGRIDAGPVAVDLNELNGISETMVGYRDWDHTAGPTGAGGGVCVASSDCRVNAIRQQIHDLVDPDVDPHEPCLDGVCQSLWLASQCTQWSSADGPAVGLWVANVEVSEDGCAPHAAVFRVHLARDPDASLNPVVTVQYVTADGTAVAGVDYTPTSGTLTLTPLERVATVTVPIVDALVPGPDKTFRLQLSNASGAVIANPIGTATLHAPGVAKCASCGLSCDDGNTCSVDSCDNQAGCRNVDLARCNYPHAVTEPLPNGSFCTPITGCPIPDGDGDGLNDAWESQGYVDLNCDGIQDDADLPLPAADPQVRDVFLQYDYMDATSTGGHSHEPAPAAMQAVVDAFERQGIALHAERGEALPHATVVTYDPLVPACSGDDAVNFYDLKAAHFDARRRPAYHYAVFGHYNTCDPEHCSSSKCIGQPVAGSGGLAELPGNDLIVSLGAYYDLGLVPAVENEAGVAIHELGHNLGLRHGGDDDLPTWMPNFLSAMNPNFTYVGIPVAASSGSTTPVTCAVAGDCPPDSICSSSHTCVRIDYSNQDLPDLDELHLDEPAGIAAGSDDITTYSCPDPEQTVAPGAGTGPIDWNCDEQPGDPDVAVDVNGDGLFTSLRGHADWPALDLAFQCTAGGSADGPLLVPAPGSRDPRPPAGEAAPCAGCSPARDGSRLR